MYDLLAWPVVESVLISDESHMPNWDHRNEGTENWLIEISREFPPVNVERQVDIQYSEHGVLVLQGGGRIINLNKTYVESLCGAYFQSFHCTFPILDFYQFHVNLVPQLCSQFFDKTHDESAMVLLVLGLGCVAQEAAMGRPFLDETGRSTGVRGGTISQPPGNVFVCEAKRRLGLLSTSWNLQSLRCHILLA